MDEEWRVIQGFPDKYFVSNLGRIKSINGKFKKSMPDGYISNGSIDVMGYRITTLRNKLEKQQIRIHRLVAIAFIPNPNNKPQVNHKDSNKQNNHVDNLEWVTGKENLQHAISVGRHNLKGQNHPQAKLTKDDVLAIRQIRSEKGLSHSEIAKMFGICRRQCGDIINGVNWGWLK